MVNYSQVHNDRESLIFQSLADPTRREILKRLIHSPLTVAQIAQPYRVSLPAISKQLKVLEHADLISRKKQGRTYEISLNPQALHTVEEYISYYRKFWNKQLDNLEEFLQKQIAYKKGGENGQKKD